MKRRQMESPTEPPKHCDLLHIIFDSLYLVSPTLTNNHNPVIVKELKRLSVVDISGKIKQDFAGRLSPFESNWRKICTDRWVLHVIQGYHIEWTTKPYQELVSQ